MNLMEGQYVTKTVIYVLALQSTSMSSGFTRGERVRVDIPDETDPDHDSYHGRQGTIEDILADDVDEETGDERDSYIYRIKFDDGETVDFRWRDLRPAFEE